MTNIYDLPVWAIGLLLMSVMLLSIELGRLAGRRSKRTLSTSAQSQIEQVQTSLLGVLALMLGFTFSMALERFNSRSDAVIQEANAIGTATLRADLLDPAYQAPIQALLRAYTHVRIEAAHVPSNEESALAPLHLRAVQLQKEIWDWSMKAARHNPTPVTSGYFVQSVNEMIDAYGRRLAEIDRQVPQWVLVILYGCFFASASVMGYTSGIHGHRPARPVYMMMGLIVLLMVMVMDLDRPRRGLIKVPEGVLIEMGPIGSQDHGQQLR